MYYNHETRAMNKTNGQMLPHFLEVSRASARLCFCHAITLKLLSTLFCSSVSWRYNYNQKLAKICWTKECEIFVISKFNIGQKYSHIANLCKTFKQKSPANRQNQQNDLIQNISERTLKPWEKKHFFYNLEVRRMFYNNCF